MKKFYALFSIALFLILAYGMWNAIMNDSVYESQKKCGGRWLYILQNANPIEISTYDGRYVVVDFSRDGTYERKYTPKEVKTMKSEGKKVLAYLSIGEAEDYRHYWKNINMSLLGEENPEWKGNYPVKYWEKEWKNIIYEYLDIILSQGFDGVYLDRVDAYIYWKKHYNESFLKNEMAKLIMEIRDYVKRKNKDFLVFIQNGEGVLTHDPFLWDHIDGLGVEDVFYNGMEVWNEEEKEWINNNRVPIIIEAIKKNKIVLSVEYIYGDEGKIGNYLDVAKNMCIYWYVAMPDRELDEIITLKFKNLSKLQ